MMTATEAKISAFRNRTRGYFHIAESRITQAALDGELMCSINLDEIPGGNISMLYEVSYLLNELGYQTFINEYTLTIYWTVKKPYHCEVDYIEDDIF